MVKARKIILSVAAVLLAAVCGLLLFLPFPKAVEAEQEYYTCRWESGEVTAESYSAAYPALVGATEHTLLLERDGKAGEIAASEEFSRAVGILERAELAEMLAFRLGEVTRLERAALWKLYGGRGYYAREFFAWDGELVTRTAREKFEEVFLLTGTLPQGLLGNTGAKKLIVSGAAELKARSLVGSEITEIEAFAPYSATGGAVYLETVVGRALVAALPNVEELALDCEFLYEGALAPCIKLKRLTLPKGHEGTLQALFGETPVPEGLVCL